MIRIVGVALVLACFLRAAGPCDAGMVGPGGTTGTVSSGSPLPGAGADPIYTFTFTGYTGLDAIATLNTVASGLGDDSMLITGGTLVVTGSTGVANSDFDGTYTLLPGGPIPFSSPFPFNVDNLYFPNDDAGSGINNFSGDFGSSPIANPSFLDVYGMLFGKGPGTTGPADEVNLYGDGSGVYTIGAEEGGRNLFGPIPTPEPASLTLLAMGFLAFGGFRLRRWFDGKRALNRCADSSAQGFQK